MINKKTLLIKLLVRLLARKTCQYTKFSSFISQINLLIHEPLIRLLASSLISKFFSCKTLLAIIRTLLYYGTEFLLYRTINERDLSYSKVYQKNGMKSISELESDELNLIQIMYCLSLSTKNTVCLHQRANVYPQIFKLSANMKRPAQEKSCYNISKPWIF